MFAVVKKLDREQVDIKNTMVQANQALKADQLDKAYELFT